MRALRLPRASFRCPLVAFGSPPRARAGSIRFVLILIAVLAGFIAPAASPLIAAPDNAIAEWSGLWDSDMPGEPRSGYIESRFSYARQRLGEFCWIEYTSCAEPHSRCVHWPSRRERHSSWEESFVDLETDGFRARVFGRLVHSETNGAGQESYGLTTVRWVNACGSSSCRAAVAGRTGVRVSLGHDGSYGAAVAVQIFRSDFLARQQSLPNPFVTALGLSTQEKPHVEEIVLRAAAFQWTFRLPVYIRRAYSHERLFLPVWRPPVCTSSVDFTTEILLHGALESSTSTFFYNPPSEIKLYSWSRFSVVLGLDSCR
ncbi:MAG TPA: hypothetical protein VK116_15685 [Planctomycetota bacterium]|nr:hypothetical protein [Planctomycetota bacterium]